MLSTILQIVFEWDEDLVNYCQQRYKTTTVQIYDAQAPKYLLFKRLFFLVNLYLQTFEGESTEFLYIPHSVSPIINIFC